METIIHVTPVIVSIQLAHINSWSADIYML